MTILSHDRDFFVLFAMCHWRRYMQSIIQEHMRKRLAMYYSLSRVFMPFQILDMQEM